MSSAGSFARLSLNLLHGVICRPQTTPPSSRPHTLPSGMDHQAHNADNVSRRGHPQGTLLGGCDSHTSTIPRRWRLWWGLPWVLKTQSRQASSALQKQWVPRLETRTCGGEGGLPDTGDKDGGQAGEAGPCPSLT